MMISLIDSIRDVACPWRAPAYLKWVQAHYGSVAIRMSVMWTRKTRDGMVADDTPL